MLDRHTCHKTHWRVATRARCQAPRQTTTNIVVIVVVIVPVAVGHAAVVRIVVPRPATNHTDDDAMLPLVVGYN